MGMYSSNSLGNNAPDVVPITKTDTQPYLQGGSLADGTYYRTEIDNYSGTAVTTASRSTLSIAGLSWSLVTRDGTGADVRSSGAIDALGTMLSLNQSCPSSQHLAFSYDASTPMKLLMLDNNTELLSVYTKQ